MLAFSILVSPAINWLSQGEYYTRSHMVREGASASDIERTIAEDQRIVTLLREDNSYETYPPELLTVALLTDTERSMIRPVVAESWWRALAISLFAPRQITVGEYMTTIDAFLDAVSS